MKLKPTLLLISLLLVPCTTCNTGAEPLGDVRDLGFPGDPVAHSVRPDRDKSTDRKERDRRRTESDLRRDQMNSQRRPDLTDAERDPDPVPMLYDSFDGSEFNAKTFLDTDFSQHMFRDLTHAADKRAGDLDHPFDDGLKRESDHSQDFLAADRKKEMDDKHDKDWLKFVQPSPALPAHDWVPDKLDPVSNGGFEVSPDNGSPVPYRLNGHVDPQRKLPWAPDTD